MAFALQEKSAPVQIVACLVVAGAIVAAGLYVPFSPINQLRLDLETARAEKVALEAEVTPLRVQKAQHSRLQADMKALEAQLENLRKIVPEEKEVDGFVREVHQMAVAARVEIRKMKSLPVNTREFHSEMPFEVTCDGPYYAVLDFFGKMGSLSRIINVSDLEFVTPAKEKSRKYPLAPGTTMTGKFMATTFYTKSEEPPPSKGKGAPAKR